MGISFSLYPRQHLFVVFLIIAVVTDMECYFLVVLISISLIISAGGYLYVFGKLSIQVLISFFFFFFAIELYKVFFLVFWILTLYEIYILQISSLIQ